MEFRILGPLEVAEHGSRLEIGRGKERSVLAILLLHANEVVSSERLIDELWGEAPPATAAKTVQVYVSRLRKALASDGSRGLPDGVLLTRGGGYALRVEPGQLDAECFQQGLAQAERSLAAGAPAEVSETLRRALALWRGPALADFAYEPFAELEIARLEELRLVAIEQRIDADLELGRHAAVVAELDTLVARHPLRERFWEQLMLGLYRSGRQTEALQAFRRARHVLVEDAGLEPGEPLRALERAILAHDPALAFPRSTGAAQTRADDDASKALRPRRSLLPAILTRYRLALLVGGALVLGVAILAAVSQLGGGSARVPRASPGLLSPNSVGRIDPRTGAILASVAVPGGPARLALAGDELWVASDRSRTVSTLDARTRAVSAVIAPGSFPTDLALGNDAGWVLDAASGRLLEISRPYGAVARRVTIDRSRVQTSLPEDRSVLDNPWSVAAGLGSVWVTDGSTRLVRVDPHTGRVVGGIDVGHPLNGVAVGEGAIWTIAGRAASVARIDPQTRRVTDRIAIASRPGPEAPYPIAIEVGLGSVWVLNANVATVTRIHARERVAETVSIGVERGPLRLAVGGGAAWVANGDGTLSRIDADTNAVTTTAIGHRLLDVAAGRGGVWVTAGRGLAASSAAPGRAPTHSGLQALPASRCSPIYYHPGERPRLLIASSLPLQGPPGEVTNQMTAAIQFILRANHFTAGRYAVGYQACDDSTVAESSLATSRCASNAKAYAKDDSVIGVISPFNSDCATAAIPIANRARPGPLALISGSTTYVGLTRRGFGLLPGEPDAYYPTGTRNFIRIVAADDFQAAADAILARRLGLRRVFIVKERPVPGERDPYAIGITSAFRAAAEKLGVAISGGDNWTSDQPSYASLARKIKRSGADGVFLGGAYFTGTGRLIKDLRAGLGGNVQLLAPDGLAIPDLGNITGLAGEGMTVSAAGVPPDALTGPGARFVARFGATLGQTPEQYAVYAAQATQLLLDAIAHSNGTRASVNHELLTSKVHHGILGDFAITPSGDTTANKVTIYRLTSGKLIRLTVLTPPPNLVKRF
jgi:DNA-binding SARP family transcriptional activator/ABC-type branched-subunit amino acid transport system substrate-binding protein/DNA-binding beta-propeller fold protein YncE